MVAPYTNGQTPDQLAPHSSDAEEAVIGSILIAPHILLLIAAILQANDFFVIRNAWIFAAMLAIVERGDELDYITLCNELRERGQLDQIGGPAYITYIINNTATHIHAETYARIIERNSVRRQLLDKATKIGQIALQDGAELDDTITAAESELFQVTRKRRQHNRPVPLRESAAANFDETERRFAAGERGIPGLPTGFPALDTLIGGFQAGLYILLGRSKMGKTALALSMILFIARWLLKQGKNGRILYVTLEENIPALTRRLEVMTSGLQTQQIRTAAFNEVAWDRYAGAHVELSDLPIDFLDMRDKTDSDITRAIDLYCQENELALVVVDFLQRVKGTRTGKNGYTAERRNVEVKDVAYSFADAAALLNIPIIGTVQAKQEIAGRDDKLPTEYDGQESDGIVQACTGMITFVRPSVYNKNLPTSEASMAVVANRNGINGPVPCKWIGETMQMVTTEA